MALSRNSSTTPTDRSGRGELAASRLVARRPAIGPERIDFKARRAPYVAAKAVGSFVPGLTKKSFEKFGFATAQLITDWPTVAGPDVARFTVPERIRWPRLPMGGDDESEGGRAATLMLRVDPARALDVEYKRAQLIERINVYFGYRAVADIRIVQGAVDASPSAGKSEAPGLRPRPAGKPAPGRVEAAAAALDDVADERLRQALARLGDGIRSGAAKS